MKTIYLQDENYDWIKFEYESLSDIENEFKIRNIKIGYGVEIGNNTKIADNAEIGFNTKIGDGVEIGDGAEIGDNAEIGSYNAIFCINLYKYSCGGWIDPKNIQWIQLGCFTRKRIDWEADFWNNPKEFSNNDSESSKARMRAFKVICFFLDQITTI